jgi:hypothetical protein
MDEIKVTPVMIAAGVEALAFVGDVAAETVVEIIFRAMVQAAYEEVSRGSRPLH